MKKVAIVGVEGSGKTVMLSCLADRYATPDVNGVFLTPCDFETWSYTASVVSRMRTGEWPVATSDDAMKSLGWTLACKVKELVRPMELAKLLFLDFPGEIYRAAYGIDDSAANGAHSKFVSQLRDYIVQADVLIVLINLRDVIVSGAQDKRVQESIWITQSILDSVLDGKRRGRAKKCVSIALTQTDSYADTIRSCGGARGVLEQYLPCIAANYDRLEVFPVMSVDKTRLNDDGNLIPDSDFSTEGLQPLMDWILDRISPVRRTTLPPDLADFNFDRCSLEYDVKAFSMNAHSWSADGVNLLINAKRLGIISKADYNEILRLWLSAGSGSSKTSMKECVLIEVRRIYGPHLLREADGVFLVPVQRTGFSKLLMRICRFFKK